MMASVDTAFKITSRCGLARTGAWRGLATPLVTRYTKGGAAPYLTPEDTEPLGSTSSPHHATTIRFADVYGQGAVMLKSGKPLSSYVRTRASATILTVRDTMAFSEPQNGAKHMAVQTPGGRSKVTPAQFAEAVKSFRPDVAVCMAHEVLAHARRKHHEASVSRSQAWLAEVLKALHDVDVDVFAVVTGGPSLPLLTSNIEHMAAVEGVSGYVYGGLGSGETPDERVAMMTAMHNGLPKEKLRMVAGVDGPWDILQAVAHGVDIIDSAYAFKLASMGCAATFPTSFDDEAKASDGDTEMGKDGEAVDGKADETQSASKTKATKIHLVDHMYTLDQRPLVEGCQCFTCQNHTRAYIRHLLDAHEMLGFVLLFAHNVHHMDKFLASVRSAIDADKLEQFMAAFGDAIGISE